MIEEKTALHNPGWVYFIQAGDAVKIGYSSGVTKRMQSMQTGNHHGLVLLAQISGDRALERQYHTRFAKFRIKGEWFHAVPPIMKEASTISGVRHRSPLTMAATPRQSAHALSPEAQERHYRLDCEMRSEADETRRMQFGLRMSMERNGATPQMIRRQDRLMGRIVRVKAISQPAA